MKKTIKLREYQKNLIKLMREKIYLKHTKLILCSPTGSGKTIMFSFMASEHLKRNGKVLVFTNRKELLTQTGGAFDNFDLKPKYIKASEKSELQGILHIAMIETFSRRIEKYKDFQDFINSRTLIIIDEAHLGNFDKIFKYINKDTIVIGATATPFRKNKEKQLIDFYSEIVQNIDTAQLIEMGFLSRPETFGVEINLKGLKKKGDEYDTSAYYDKNKIYEGVLQNYEKLALGKKTILFASNVESSKKVCQEFINYGYNAKHIDATTKNRDEIFQWYNETPNAILCNCGIATTGFDQPDIEVVILYFATTSIIKMLQCIGRGSRVTENKNKFRILDFGNNIQRLGFWEDERIWSLKKKKKEKQGVAPVKYCPKCNAILPTSTNVCPFCEFEFKETKEEIEEKIFAELKLLTKKEAIKKAQRGDLYEKSLLAKSGAISGFWVLHQLTDIEEARLFIKLMGWKKGFEFYNKHRFKVFQK